MLLKWLVCVAVLNLSPVYVYSKDIPRIKRSDQDMIPCEKGWFHFGEKCYKLGGRAGGRVSWQKAEEICKSLDGDLVTIQSEEENDFLASYMILDIQSSAWIGLHDQVNESIYAWNDGTPVEYTNWKITEPTGLALPEEDCVEMIFEAENDAVGKWNDLKCDDKRAYICEAAPKSNSKMSPNPMYCSAEEGGGWRYRNSCFHVVTESKSFDMAEKHCNDVFDGHLVTILDTTVDIFVSHMLSDISKDMWIGIKIQDQLQQQWTSGWFVSYNGFNKEHGDFVEGNCVLRKKRKVWTMDPCSKKHSFICEMSTVDPPALKLPAKGSYCPEEPDGWRDLDGEFCYFIELAKTLSWHEANFDCLSRGGNLVSLHSQEESDILFPFLKYSKNQKVYIGLLRLMGEDDIFAWSDGSVMDYRNWGHGEPNSHEEKCGEVWTHDMLWNDGKCEERRGYICSVRKIQPNTTETVERIDCTGHISYRAMIGVSVCVCLVVILLGIVVYYFHPSNVERRKNSAAIPVPPPYPSTNRPRYRTTELKGKDDEYYEFMQ